VRDPQFLVFSFSSVFFCRFLLLPDSKDSEKAVKTEIGWLLLNAANGEYVKELIDERVVCGLLKSSTNNFNIGKSVQVPKLITWLIRHNPGNLSLKDSSFIL
jgi:hypothetical protein